MKRIVLTLGLFSLALAACSGGENGLDGKDGKDGDSCTITNNEDGTATITCPDGSSFTVKNGEDGKKGDAGSDGSNGESCKIVKNSDGSSAVVCQYDGSSYRLVDGKDGQSCYQVENIDGSLAVVCPYDGTSFIVRGNTDNYENYCKSGFYGRNCENECSCNEHQNCNDGATGDSSCTCKNLWIGQDCNQCDLTKAYGFNCTPYGGVADQDGNTYKTVTIGEQTWMAENLKATKDINGNNVTCYANTDEKNGGVSDFVEKYGCLYVWEELATLNGKTNKENTNRICPSGWRLPTKIDFNNLLTYVTNNRTASSNFLALIKKSTAWKNYSNQGVDEFGFGALPAGYYISGYYLNFGLNGLFWSTEDDGSVAYYLGLGLGDASVKDFNEIHGFSVRCLKDSN